MEYVETDGHTFDLFVSVVGKNGKLMAIRPKIITFIDVKTHMILGDTICIQPDAQVIKKAACKMIYGKPGGLPKHMRMDNGKEFTAEKNIGQNRKERTCNLDGEVRGFCQSMGILEWSHSNPYEAWTKGCIERAFLTIVKRFRS